MYVENAGKKTTWSIKFYYFYFHRFCKKNISIKPIQMREKDFKNWKINPLLEKTPNKRFQYYCKNGSKGFDQI